MAETWTWNFDEMEPVDDEESGGGEGPEGPEGPDGPGGGEGPEGPDGPGIGGGKDGKLTKEEEDFLNKIDEHHKKIEDSFGDKEDLDSKDLEKRKEKEKEREKASLDTSEKTQKGGRGDSADRSIEFDPTKVKPTFSWGQVVRNMVTSASVQTDETYQKPSRRNITGLETARQTGAAAIKPGEISKETDIKLLFVIDSSGSMSGSIAKIYSNISYLLQSNKDVSSSDFFLIKFSSDYYIYKCNLAAKSYVKLSEIDEKNSKKEKGDLANLFSEHLGASTNFTAPLVNDILKLTSQNYNVLVLSDSDILDKNNLKQLSRLFEIGKNKINLIVDRRNTYIELIKEKFTSKNITYFKDED